MAPSLVTVERFPPAVDFIRRGVPPAAALPMAAARADPSLPPPPGGSPEGPPAYAVANHGRWVVECECAAAQVTSPADPRFFCPSCGNAAALPGRWRPVVWPADVEAVTSALLARPDPRTRNWSPPETAADLLRENAVNLTGGR